MATRLFLVRHGQSVFNQEGRSQGWLDSPLTDRGKAEALVVRKWFEDHHLHFACGYSSDLSRAKETLALIDAGQFPMQERKDLREMSLGKMDGQKGFHLDPAVWNQQAKLYGGETFEQAAQRAILALYQIAKTHPGQNVLVISHGMILNLLMDGLPAVSAAWHDPDQLENGMVLELIFTAGKLWLSRIDTPVSDFVAKHNAEQ